MQFMKQNMQKVFRKDNTFSLVQMDSFMLLVILSFYDNCMYSISRDLVPVSLFYLLDMQCKDFFWNYFIFPLFYDHKQIFSEDSEVEIKLTEGLQTYQEIRYQMHKGFLKNQKIMSFVLDCIFHKFQKIPPFPSF